MIGLDFEGPDPFVDPARRGRALRHVIERDDGHEERIDDASRPMIDPLTGADLRPDERVRETRPGRWTVDRRAGTATYRGAWWGRS